MKKWLYVLAPAVMIAVFLFFYFDSKAAWEAKEKARLEEVAQAKSDAEAKKHVAEAKAREDAERRNAERAAEDAKVAKDKQDKYDADMARIQSDTDRANATAESYAKQVSDLTIELDSLHKQKDALTREDFDLEKKVEMARVARQNAELEIQRTVEMISTRADESAMAKPPPPPPPKTS
jgi:chromosome segregation ATPase